MSKFFKEKQKFSSWIYWSAILLFVPLATLLLYGLYSQLVLGKPFGTSPGSDTELIIVSVLILALFAFILFLFKSMQLETQINDSEIHIRYKPFINKTIPWQEVESAELIKYGFVGGWGIRLWTRYGTAYNVRGNTGLHLKLKNGKQYLIGTQKKQELEEIVNSILRN